MLFLCVTSVRPLMILQIFEEPKMHTSSSSPEGLNYSNYSQKRNRQALDQYTYVGQRSTAAVNVGIGVIHRRLSVSSGDASVNTSDLFSVANRDPK